MVYLKITDRFDMTSSVYRGHKAILKQIGETMKTDIVFVCLFGLRLHVLVNIFQSCRDGATASWVLPVLFGR